MKNTKWIRFLPKKSTTEWGPLDWRLPEAQRDLLGRARPGKGEGKSRQSEDNDLIKLRRSIYQSMLQAIYHGRLVINPFDKS